MKTPTYYFNKNFKNVAVKLSGGTDSSLLYYKICEFYKGTNTNIFPITLVSDKKPFYRDNANRIALIVKVLTGVSPTQHIFVEGPHSEYEQLLNNAVLNFHKQNKLDIVYTGMTINPPLEKLSKSLMRWNYEKYDSMEYNYPSVNHYKDITKGFYHIEKRDSKRDIELNTDPISIVNNTTDLLCNSPFSECTKKAVANEYEKLDLMESLFPFTISCADYTDETYTTLDEHSHCENNCFPCIERYWAFRRFK
jgi:hypothetical protein|tara:strand:- start:960 stop:1712 length:753 start_codon:yes stop_codon:yes gene_type:complete